MKTKLTSTVSCILALGLAACSGGTGNDDASVLPPTDGPVALPDTAPDTLAPPPVQYTWVVIQDTEQKACTTNGPGADIDAVELFDAASNPIGWGKPTSARFTPNPLGNACENADCNGGNCKYAYIGTGTAFNTANPPAVRIAWTEGEPDATVGAGTADDKGYFSLNAGTLQIQIADAITGLVVPFQSGDMIKVFEVDKSYIASGDAPATCSCLPEHYTVTLQSATNASDTIPLQPILLDPSNTTCSALTAASTDGCGSTVFQVP